MTRQEMGRHGGASSGETRRRQAQARIRRLALASLRQAGLSPSLADLILPTIAEVYNKGYHAGIGARWVQRQRRERAQTSEAA